MRSLSKTLAGGVLAALLVLSASPAQAFGPTNLTPETEQSVPPVETPVEAVEPEVPVVDEPVAEEPAAEEPVAEDPATEVPAENEAQNPEEEAPVASEDESDELSEDTAEPTEAEPVAEAPSSVAFTGTVTFVPEESQISADIFAADQNGDAAEADHAHDDAGNELGGEYLVATDAGPLLSITQDQIATELEVGQTITGTVVLSTPTRDAVDAEIAAAEGAITTAEVLQIAEETESAADQPLTIAGAVAAAPVVAEAVSTRAHTADVVFVTGGAARNNTDLINVVKNSSSYWNGQTAGKVSKITPSTTVKRISPAVNDCNTTGLWNAAAKEWGHSTNWYQSGARHLVVFINAGGVCGGSGYGTLGTLHRGGLIWIDMDAIGGTGTATANSRGTTAHEFGHNLGLGHGQARLCSGNTVDSQTKSQYYAPYGSYRKLPVSPCNDREYGDASNIMGAGSAMSGAKPTALSVVQKNQLGVLTAGSLKSVSASGGRSQTFTIKPASVNSGLRGLKVNSINGGSFVVEYRSGTGQDSGLPWANGSEWTGGPVPSNYVMTTGVQVTKNDPSKLAANSGGGTDLRETVITSRQGNEKYLAMKPKHSVTPWNSNARVTVVSMNSSGAKVRVDFTPFIDVPYAHKFAKEINWMSSAKLSTGINAGNGLRKYEAKANVTREAMAAFLYRLSAPKNYKAPKKSPFKDVATNHKFYKEIAWMYTSKLSTGIKSGSGRIYAPKAGVTREAMAAFVYRLQKSTYKGAATSPFADVKKGQKFYKEITWMKAEGLSTGVKQPSGKPKYQPKNNVTREAMAAFIYRLKH